MACILYNIGALHSELGTKDPRVNADGMKVSEIYFSDSTYFTDNDHCSKFFLFSDLLHPFPVCGLGIPAS